MELLVVVAVIAVLASFLLPALSQVAKRASHTAAIVGGGNAPGVVFWSGFEWPYDESGDATAEGWNHEAVKPNGWQPGGAAIGTSILHASEGTRSLQCYVPDADPESTAREGATSKSHLGYKDIQYTRDQVVTVSADFYIPAASSGRVTLFDIEDNRRAGNPGIRIQVEEGRVTYNPDKLGLPIIRGPATIPKEQWFELRVELLISDTRDGRVRIWVEEALVLEEDTQTLLVQMLGYTSIQGGITARLETEYELFMDNFLILLAPA